MKNNKKCLLVLLFLSLVSCQITSPYLIKSFQEYPEGLTKKEFIKLNEDKELKIFYDKKWQSIRSIKDLKNNYNESNYFKSTFYKEDDSIIINSLNILYNLKFKQWVLPPIYQEIYGINGTIWISKEVKDSINKIQKKHLDYLFRNTQLILDNKESKLLYPIYKKSFKYNN